MSYRLGIDIGGTFTDFALLKGDAVRLYKNLSTPQDRSLGVMTGVSALAEQEGLSIADLLAQCESIVHGTTVADNTLIEMNGAVTGLLTTEGFRDELEYRRGYKEDIWDVRLPPPKPIVPRRRRLTLPERLLSDGAVHQALDEEAVRAQCRRLRLQGVESVAVSLLFAFVNPVHERRVAEIVAEELPGVPVSLSHQVLPRAPEFDRTSTTVVNAYVGPRVSAYLDRLVERLAEAGYRNRLMVMQSTGGVMSREYIAGAPVRVLASGPAGGVIGSAHVGVRKGFENILCVDMGGTSYDISMVLNGEAPAVAGWNMHHRYLVGVPMIQVETLGAGGGSICRVNNGEIEVGPASAGSDPGPICYGRGGTAPTVTDALLMTGILSAEQTFAGGSFALQRAGVDAAFQQLGDAMGYDAEQAAVDCLRVVNATMSLGVRRTTAGKGVDPRELVMLAYGGNGPAFAAVQADELGIRTVLVPRTSPTFSALGTLVADPGIDEERSCLSRADHLDLPRLRALWQALAQNAAAAFEDAGFSRDQIDASWMVNMRYPGQNWVLSFELARTRGVDALDFINDALSATAIQRFNERHAAEYGHVRAHEVPEMTGVRLETRIRTPSPGVQVGSRVIATPATPAGHRRAHLGQGFQQTPVYHGADLMPGAVIPAPAIIEESFTTLVVYPGWEARVDDAGDYLMTRVGEVA